MKEIKALLFVKPGDTSGFRKFYSFVLMCETFSKSTAWNVLETIETLCILVSKLLVVLGIGGTESYRWLEENHVYQIFLVLYTEKPPWSITLFFKGCCTGVFSDSLKETR